MADVNKDATVPGINLSNTSENGQNKRKFHTIHSYGKVTLSRKAQLAAARHVRAASSVKAATAPKSRMAGDSCHCRSEAKISALIDEARSDDSSVERKIIMSL